MMTKLGIYSLLAGFFLGIFKGISTFMASQNFWVDLTISKLIGENNSETIIGLTGVSFVQDSLDLLLYDVPFFVFMLGLGVVFLVISLFVKNH